MIFWRILTAFNAVAFVFVLAERAFNGDSVPAELVGAATGWVLLFSAELEIDTLKKKLKQIDP